MKAYSVDLRERIVRAVKEGRERSEIMALFGVSLATIKRYVKQQQEMGELTPRTIPGRPPKKREAVVELVLPQLQANADRTREEHCQLFLEEHGIQVSPATMGRAFQQLGWTRKKRPSLL